jgi:hypothetical protein
MMTATHSAVAQERIMKSRPWLIVKAITRRKKESMT